MLNNLSIQGRLTKEPDLQVTATGVATCKVVIANESSYKDQNGQRITSFISCKLWRSNAENLCKYCHKGDLITVQGELIIRSYEKDNERRYVTEIEVEKLHFNGIKHEHENEGIAAATSDQATAMIEAIDHMEDDLPF